MSVREGKDTPDRSAEPDGTCAKRTTTLVAAHGDGSLRIYIYVMDNILVDDYHGDGAGRNNRDYPI